MEKHIRLTGKEKLEETLLADVLYVFADWQNNWACRDFEEAFKSSPAGWEWLWDKFESHHRNPYSFYMCLDQQHQVLLVRYLFEGKYQGEIQRYRMHRAIFKHADEGGD